MNSYSEDLLVEQSVIQLFAELGWATVSALEESFGFAGPPSPLLVSGRGGWLGRAMKLDAEALRGGGAVESGTACGSLCFLAFVDDAVNKKSKTSRISLPSGYAPLLADLKARVRAAQVRAVLSINRERVLLYWNIGRDILRCQRPEGWERGG